MSDSARSWLILGGARSGKSRRALAHAERAAAAMGDEARRVYIATAQAFDDEMAARIQAHQRERGPAWETIEAPLALAEALAGHCSRRTVVVVDCLTLWLSNIVLAERDIDHDCARLVDAIARVNRDRLGVLGLVSNEVGLGIVPDNALARRFRDAQGRLNQDVAAAVDRVEFIAAGLPLRMK